VGCLRAATALGSDEGSITLCRTKIAAQSDAGAGTPDAELAIAVVTVCQGGACTTTSYPALDPAPGGPGDLIRLEVSPGAGGPACAQARSAATAGPDLVPVWVDLGAPACFPGPLPYQGLATPSTVWFFGTRHERSGALAPAGAADFAGVVAESHTAADAGPIDAGTYRDAGSLLVDDSAP
jgi:hypothetical protein